MLSSVGKIFTAVTVAKLIEQKQLSFDTTLGALVPDYSRWLRIRDPSDQWRQDRGSADFFAPANVSEMIGVRQTGNTD